MHGMSGQDVTGAGSTPPCGWLLLAIATEHWWGSWLIGCFIRQGAFHSKLQYCT